MVGCDVLVVDVRSRLDDISNAVDVMAWGVRFVGTGKRGRYHAIELVSVSLARQAG